MISGEFIQNNLNFSKKFTNNLSSNFYLLIVFLLISVFFYTRVYKLGDKFGFDHDQEYAAETSWKLIKEKKLSLVGIETSTGGIFTGPALSWTQSLSLLIWRFDPIALGYQAIIFSFFGLVIIYMFVLTISDKIQALFAAWVYTFSPRIIPYDISASPISYFFIQSVLVLCAYYLVIYRRKVRFLPLLAFVLGLGYHIHVVLLLEILPVLFLLIRGKERLSKFLVGISIFSFLLPLSTFILFEIRHGFLMSNNLFELIFSHSSGYQFVKILKTCLFLLADIFLKIKEVRPLWIFPISILAIHFYTKKKHQFYNDMIIFMAIPLVPMLLYKGPITEYYFLFLAAPFLVLTSRVLKDIFSHYKYLSTLLILAISVSNLFYISGEINPHSLNNKKSVVNFIKFNSMGQAIKVNFDIPQAYNYGFNYLIKWSDLKIDSNAQKTYVIEHVENINYKNLRYGSDERFFGYFGVYSIK